MRMMSCNLRLVMVRARARNGAVVIRWIAAMRRMRHIAVILPRVLSAESIAASRKSSFTSFTNTDTYDRKKVDRGVSVGVDVGGPALLGRLG